MKTDFRKLIVILLVGIIASGICGCTYDEKPPKTDDASSNYVLPGGERLSDEEIAAVTAAKAEYDEAVGI